MGGGKSADRTSTHPPQGGASRFGYPRSVGRARGSIRWQKSTDGAWPCAPGREERSVAAGSSGSSSPKGARARERAPEAGRGWPNPPVGGGSAFEVRRESAGPSGHSSMEGARVRSKPRSLTGSRGRTHPAVGSTSVLARRRKGARGSGALPRRGRKRRRLGGADRGPFDRGPTGSARTRPPHADARGA